MYDRMNVGLPATLGKVLGSLFLVWWLAGLIHRRLRWHTPVSALGCGLIAGTLAVVGSGLVQITAEGFDAFAANPTSSVWPYMLATVIYVPLKMSKTAREAKPASAVERHAERDLENK